MDIFGVLSLIGGLALFLYGMHVMGAGLEKMSGGRLERILENLTSNPLKAVLLGAGVTAVIQSSSATTVMVVGFVNSGIMKLSQAIGIIKIQETEAEANRFGLRCSMRFPFLQEFHSCSGPTAARPHRGYLRSEGSFPPAIGTRPAGSSDRGIPAAPSRCTPSPAAGGRGFGPWRQRR